MKFTQLLFFNYNIKTLSILTKNKVVQVINFPILFWKKIIHTDMVIMWFQKQKSYEFVISYESLLRYYVECEILCFSIY